MSLTGWIGSLLSRRQARRADERRLAAIVDTVVDVVDPRIRGLPGYRRTLAPAIEQVAVFAQEIVTALPPPVEISRERWADTPFLRSGFATVDAMQEVFDSNRALRDFLTSAEARGAREIYAGIGMQMHRRRQLGQELRGELLQTDVEQVAVSFDGHRLGAMATDESRLQALLQQRVGREHPVTAQGEPADGERCTAHMNQLQPVKGGRRHDSCYSTVTDLARLRGLSTSVPFCTATW